MVSGGFETVVNRYLPHLLILAEDEATRAIANGFLDATQIGAPIYVLRAARGWGDVLNQFLTTYAAEMVKYPHMHMILLIDFDKQYRVRFADFVRKIPVALQDRVFILGALDEAESACKLSQLNKLDLGHALAQECRSSTFNHWNNIQLCHNISECNRLLVKLPAFLF